MQETFRDPHRRRWVAKSAAPMPTKEQGYGIANGGSIIHELGCVRMGKRSEHQRAQRALPGMGLQEPLRRRRRAVRLAGRQESDLDHSRTLDAHVALHRESAEGREAVSDQSLFSRRELVAGLAAATAGAFLQPSAARASEATKVASAARGAATAAGTVYQPKIYTAHEYATVQALVDEIIPKDDKSRLRHRSRRAGIHGYHARSRTEHAHRSPRWPRMARS